MTTLGTNTSGPSGSQQRSIPKFTDQREALHNAVDTALNQIAIQVGMHEQESDLFSKFQKQSGHVQALDDNVTELHSSIAMLIDQVRDAGKIPLVAMPQPTDTPTSGKLGRAVESAVIFTFGNAVQIDAWLRRRGWKQSGRQLTQWIHPVSGGSFLRMQAISAQMRDDLTPFRYALDRGI